MLFLRILEVFGTLLVGAAASFGAWVAWKGWQKRDAWPDRYPERPKRLVEGLLEVKKSAYSSFSRLN